MLYIISSTQHRREIILQLLSAHRLTREFSKNVAVICSFHLRVRGFIKFAPSSQFSITLELFESSQCAHLYSCREFFVVLHTVNFYYNRSNIDVKTLTHLTSLSIAYKGYNISALGCFVQCLAHRPNQRSHIFFTVDFNTVVSTQ